MTTDDHNPTSQPWLPSQPADTAGSGGEPDTGQATEAARTDPAPDNDTAQGTTDAADPETVGPDASEVTVKNEISLSAESTGAGDAENPGPSSGAPDEQWPSGPADPTAPPWEVQNGFAPPPEGQAPVGNGPLYGNAPLDQFAPGTGGAFSAPAPDQFSAAGSGQFPQPDPNQFQAANTGYGSGGFSQAEPGQFQAPGYGSGQFPQPEPGQFQVPGHDPFAPSGPNGGQYPQQDPNLYPGQPNPEQASYPPPGSDGGQFQQQPPQQGGYAPGGTPEPGRSPAPESESGGPIYSWAPPPMPAAPPPVPQQPFQQAPPQPINNPPTGQFPTPENWGANPGRSQPPAAPQQPQQQQPGQQPGQPRQMPEPGQLGHSVNDLNLLKRARKAPRSGWRRAVHKVSRGAINPGESASDVVHRDLVGRVNAPVYGDFRIAILSLKGGVGKTTTTVGLGATFASLRGDRVIAIDANPDLGTLAHRVPRQTRSTVRNLLEDQNITRYSDVRAHTSQSPSRLEVLASEQDPAVSEAFSEADYRRAIGILQSFYNIILTDCGTGLMHSAMSGVLDMASSLVLVTSPAIDGARSASATLDWLDYHGYSHLVQQTVVVVNASRRGSTSVNLDHLRRLFLDRTRAVQVVPFDDHLAEGAEIDLELVSKPTRQALLELAAMVADDFANVDGYPYGNRY
ncbi:nucleotide-binding protein [Nocardia sp. NBC_00416]|uniref:nucleotide-binding protein n=1 Tax=Nocardia sp. NBC_00416 TaxID=2975991 RepID=UPI002E1EB075